MMIQEAQNQPILPSLSSAIPSSLASGLEGKKIADEKLKKACGDFEAIFIAKVLKIMRQSIPKSHLLDGGLQQDIYNSLFDEEVSKSLAKKGGIGLGKMLYRNFRKPAAQDRPDPFKTATEQRGTNSMTRPQEEKQ